LFVYISIKPNKFWEYNNLPLIRSHPLHEKVFFIRGVASLERDNLLVFYYFSASENWSDKRGYYCPYFCEF